jgi:hypothetical protein
MPLSRDGKVEHINSETQTEQTGAVAPPISGATWRQLTPSYGLVTVKYR